RLVWSRRERRESGAKIATEAGWIGVSRGNTTPTEVGLHGRPARTNREFSHHGQKRKSGSSRASRCRPSYFFDSSRLHDHSRYTSQSLLSNQRNLLYIYLRLLRKEPGKQVFVSILSDHFQQVLGTERTPSLGLQRTLLRHRR